MKRNFELIRGLLLEIEALPPDAVYSTADSALDADPAILAAHVCLLIEGGLVDQLIDDAWVTEQENGQPYALCSDLTWHGHEFLGAVRSDQIWNEAKRLLREKGLSASAVLLKKLCLSLAKRQLGLE